MTKYREETVVKEGKNSRYVRGRGIKRYGVGKRANKDICGGGVGYVTR